MTETKTYDPFRLHDIQEVPISPSGTLNKNEENLGLPLGQATVVFQPDYLTSTLPVNIFQEGDLSYVFQEEESIVIVPEVPFFHKGNPSIGSLRETYGVIEANFSKKNPNKKVHKKQTPPTSETKTLIKTISVATQKIEGAFNEVKDFYQKTYEPFLMQTIISPETTQDVLAEHITSSFSQTNIAPLLLFFLELQYQANQLENTLRTIEKNDSSLDLIIPVDKITEVEKVLEVIPFISLLNPFEEIPQHSPTLEQIAAMKLPLQESDKRRLDTLFVPTANPELLAVMEFLISTATNEQNFGSTIKLGYQDPGKISAISPEIERFINNVGDRMLNYFHDYYAAILARKFAKNVTEEIYPEYSIIQVAIASYFTETINDLLPTNFDILLDPESDFIPDLSLKATTIFKEAYRKYFVDISPELSSNRKRLILRTEKLKDRTDVSGLHPYELVEKTYQEGNATPFLQELEAHYREKSLPSQNSPLDRITSNYKNISANVDTVFLTINCDSSIKLIDIATHGTRRFIDIIVISHDNRALGLQVDMEGNLLGIPTDYHGDVHLLMTHIMDTVVTYLEEEVIIPAEKKGIIFEQKETVLKKPAEITIPQIQETTSEKDLQKPAKRKKMRRIGMLPLEENLHDIELTQEQFESIDKLSIAIPEQVLKDLDPVTRKKVETYIERARKLGLEYNNLQPLRGPLAGYHKITTGPGGLRIGLALDLDKMTGEVLIAGYRKDVWARMAQQLGKKVGKD